MAINTYVLSQQLGVLCRKQSLRIGLAESCTGGGVAHTITSVPGSSGWFDMGFVVYSNAAKHRLLGVDEQLLERDGAVSESVAKAMAQGVLLHSDVDMALSITGVAGPAGGSDQKPVGTVCFGLASRQNNKCKAQTQFFEGGRQSIRQSSIEFALQWMLDFLK